MSYFSEESFKGLRHLRDPQPYYFTTPPNHGLDPEETRFQSRYSVPPKQTVVFKLIEWQGGCLLEGKSLDLPAVQQAAQQLEHRITGGADAITYYDLGTAQWLPENSSNNDSSGGNTSTQSIDKKQEKEPKLCGYIRLAPYLSKAVRAYAQDSTPFTSNKQEAEQLAQKILADCLPPQAFMFVPPDELAKAAQEATRVAREIFDQSLQYVNTKTQVQPKPNEPEIKSGVLRRLKGFRNRHDARFHFMPYTAMYAPETGIATIAIIASAQQSINGDYGRYAASRRSLEKSN